MNDGSASLLEPAFLAELESQQLRTRRRLAGSMAGEHRSVRRGSSLDFADSREYHPGDDYRRIDYHLLARLDQLMIKLYEADDDLHVRLVIDTSASMGVGAKLRQAARVAAALGFVTLVRRDTVSVHTFSAGAATLRQSPRFVGRHAVGPLLAHLGALRAEGRTDMVSAVADLLARPGPRGLTILISDLLTHEWSAALRRLPARGDDLTVVHVLAPADLTPPVVGELDLVDAETKSIVRVSLSPAVAAQYTERARHWADEVGARCRHLGAGYVELSSEADLRVAMRGAWRRAGVLR